MPKVGKSRIKVGDDDYNMTVEFEINVNVDGLFTTTLKEEDAEKIKGFGVTLNRNKRSGSRRGYFESETKKDLEIQVSEKVKECYTREIIDSEIILRYNLNSTAAFGFTKDGKIIPNLGYSLDGKPDTDKNWQHGTEEAHAGGGKLPFGISMYVGAAKKITYEYRGGRKKTVYENLDWGNIKEKERPYLSYICGMTVIAPTKGEVHEMEYTEKNAMFFVELFKSMCKLSAMIKAFSTPDKLKEIIDTNQKLIG